MSHLANMTADDWRWFYRIGPARRLEHSRSGEMGLGDQCRWAAHRPREVPLVNGEFEFIAMFTDEVRALTDALALAVAA